MSTEILNPYQSAAQAVYDSMAQNIRAASDNMWPYGNAFDSMADFLLLTKQQGGSFLNDVYNAFILRGDWYDDFCWPAIAAMKAFDSDYQQVFAGISTSGLPFTTIFQDYALKNWSVVYHGQAPSPIHAHGTANVWSSIDPAKWAAFTPRFQGGSWQCDINHDRNSQGRESQNPAVNSLGPFQLSVMNGLFLVFATRLAQLAADPQKYPNAQAAANEARTAVGKQLEFLFNWYGHGISTDVPAWTDAVLSFPTEADYKAHAYKAGVLVRERIGTYALQNGSYPALAYYDQDRFWGGDQGLQLGGLIDYPHNPGAIQAAVGIMEGVKNRMQIVDAAGNPWMMSCTLPWPGPMCNWCYNAGGVGIFFRNLLYALRSGNPDAINLAKSADYVKFVAAVANTAVDGPMPMPDQNPQFVNLDRLAVLNVALYYERVLGIPLGNPQAVSS